MSAPPPAVSAPSALLLVACLCAAWCRTCDAYRDTLAATRDALARAHPEAALRFVWVDIEDEAALVGDLDIEDFPTLLVARGAEVLFFGPVLPHAQTVDRLVRGMLEHPAPLPVGQLPPDVAALPARLASHAAI